MRRQTEQRHRPYECRINLAWNWPEDKLPSMEINFGNQITETEKEIEKFIANHYSFENLPPEIKKFIGNSLDTWKTNVIRYSVRHQLRWKNNLVCDSGCSLLLLRY